MKHIFYKLVLASAIVLSSGCTKDNLGYESIYTTGPDGKEYCCIQQTYNVGIVAGKLLIMANYSGAWEMSLDPSVDWAFLDKTSGNGLEYVRLHYNPNVTGTERTALITFTCDNGQVAEITVNQSK